MVAWWVYHLANPNKEKRPDHININKEKDLGMHSSGRNSGVLHAGVYYEPKFSKKAKFIEGAKRFEMV